ncbi:hypothetical protein BDF22DRAFT_466067 [Syncephalis plumigaleata]|nr:hypothetical protein BDF22DRAFT_466067 [Syncephalis plumigaleata]
MHRYIVTTAVVCYLAITSAPSCIAAPMNNVNHGSNRYKHPQQQTLPSFVNEADHGSHKYEFTKPPVLRDPVDDDDPGSNKLEINRPPPLSFLNPVRIRLELVILEEAKLNW